MKLFRLLPASLVVVTAVVSGALIASLQSPFLLAGGSDALERIVSPSIFSQWLALDILITILSICFAVSKTASLFSSYTKAALIVPCVLLFFLSGHDFRYSGRQHALIDSWFHIPVQVLNIDPTTYLDNARLSTNSLTVSVYKDDAKKILIVKGLSIWSLDQDKIIEILSDIGINNEAGAP